MACETNDQPAYLELNLRIKPRKRLKRDKPDALAVPDAANHTWSMDFMADQLADGRSLRTLNALDDFNREGLGNRVLSCGVEASDVMMQAGQVWTPNEILGRAPS